MLEIVDLGRKLPKKEYKAQAPPLQLRLLLLQRALWKAGLGSLIVVEGWDASGKGVVVNKLTQRLEPRGFTLHAIHAPRTYEQSLPWLWKFWRLLPAYGEMAIFDRSWYGRVLVGRVEKRVPRDRWRQAYREINEFERKLSADRYLFCKLLLHIDRAEQKKRLEKLKRDPLQSWRVDENDWKRYRAYDDYLLAYEEMLERTETGWAPWTIVEATDLRWARIKALETVIAALEEGLRQRGQPLPEDEPEESDESEGEP